MGSNKSKTNLFAILSLVAIIIDALVFIIWPDGDTVKLGLAICVIFAIVAFVLGIISRKQIKKSNEKGKGMALTSLILGIIMFIWTGYTLIIMYAIEDIEFNDQIMCSQVTDCVDNGDGTSTCSFAGVYEIPCSTDVLTEEQFK